MLGTMKVRPAQYSVLLIIEANPGRSQAAIGQTLGIERARLARLLHELERRKWINRHASGSDARKHSLHLTADGEKALAKIKSLAGAARSSACRAYRTQAAHAADGFAAGFRLTAGGYSTS